MENSRTLATYKEFGKMLREVARRLHSIEGKAMISSYNCPLMQELYGDWTMIKFPSKKNNIRSSEVQEVIWINYKPRSIQSIFE